MKFLVDECLTTDLVQTARGRGFLESTHVGWAGLGASQDWRLVPFALQRGFIIVTRNAGDFLRLLTKEEIHHGAVFLTAPNKWMRPHHQVALFEHALDEIGTVEPINEIIEVTATAAGHVIVRHR